MVDSVVSQRALREIYLKAFEIAVKEGGAQSIMTSYNPVNGHWTASSYDLNTTILRKEWGYTGMVMTDWWAEMNDVVEGGEPSTKKTGDMVRAQNDVYMVVNNNGAEINASGDDTMQALEEGRLTIGELQRNAMNICRLLIKMPAFKRVGKETIVIPQMKAVAQPANTEAQNLAENNRVDMENRTDNWFYVEEAGLYGVVVKLMSPDNNQAQTVCKAHLNGEELNTFQTNGTLGEWIYQKLLRVKLEKDGII